MGSNTIEVAIVLSSRGKDSTMTECSVKSTVTETENDCSTNANQPVLEPVNNDARQLKFIVWKMLEYAILSALIAMVWGLSASPIVVYHVLVQQQQQVNASSKNTTAATFANCSPVAYRGETCKKGLQIQQTCLTGRSDSQEVHIPQYINQEEMELQAHQLLTVELSFLQTSAECEVAVRPFLCLYLFSLCDSGSGQVYQPSFTECVTLMTKTCAREWQIAINTQLGQTLLPSCESLPDDRAGPEICNETTNSNASGTLEPGQTQTENSTATLLNSSWGCSDGFYLDLELDACRPQCGIWKPTSHASQAVIDAFTIMALCTAVICGSAFLILALLQRKQMFIFPKVIFVYMDLAIVLVASVSLIGYLDIEGLFCSSMDLIESAQNPTPFCKVSGFIYMYCLIQLELWEFFYCLILFWATVKPFHFGNFKTAGRLVYVHIAMVLIGIMLPFVPSFVGLSTGYSHGVRDVSTLCGSANPDADVYTVMLPISVLVASSVSMLIVIFRILLKRYMKNKGMKGTAFVTAEKKILALLLFYTVLFISTLLSYTYRLIEHQETQGTLSDYFVCEGSRSKQSDLDCNVQGLVARQLPAVATIIQVVTAIVQGFIPTFFLTLFVDFTKLKAKIVHCYSNH